MGLLGLESGTCNTAMFDVSCQINTGKNMFSTQLCPFSFCLSLSPLQNYGYDGNKNIDHMSITSLTSQSCSSISDYVNYYVQRKNQMWILVLLVQSVKSPLENNTTGQVFAWYQNSPLNPALKNLVSCGFHRGQFKTRSSFMELFPDLDMRESLVILNLKFDFTSYLCCPYGPDTRRLVPMYHNLLSLLYFMPLILSWQIKMYTLCSSSFPLFSIS